MQIDYLTRSPMRAALQRRDGVAGSQALSTSDRVFWSVLGAVSATSIILSHELLTFLPVLVKVAWLYMVAGARG